MTIMNTMRKLYTVKEVLEYFQIAESTFYNWKREGVIRPIKIKGKLFISEDEIERLSNPVKEDTHPSQSAEANSN